MAYIYMCVSNFEKQERDILRELNCQMLSQQLLGKHLQIYWEFIQELQIVSSSLKERNSFRNFISTIHCPYQSAMWLQIKVFLTSHLHFPFNYSVTLTWLKTVINITFAQTLFCIGVKTSSIDGIPYWKDGWELFILNMNSSCCNLCIFMSISYNYSYNLETYIYISLTNNDKRLVQD